MTSEFTVRARRTGLVFLFVLASLIPFSKLQGGDTSFDLTVTQDNFQLYFPAYLANGFFTTTTSLRGTDPTLSVMVGVMDYTPGDVSHPAAIPSWAEIDYYDGHSWLNATPVSPSAFRDYRQTLQMYNGVLETRYTWINAEGSSRIVVTTFVSEDSTHLAATNFTLTPDFSGPIRLRFTLRPYPAPHRIPLAKLTGKEFGAAMAAASPDPGLKNPTASDRDSIWYPGEVKIQSFGGNQAQDLVWIVGRAAGGLEVAEAAAVGLPPGMTPTEVKLHPSAHLVELEVAAQVEKGKTYSFTKYLAASREGWGGLKPDVIRWAEAARHQGFSSLLDKHEARWHELWKSDIVVEGDDEVQKTVRSDLFAVFENSTVDTRWGMQGMGLTPNYMGHIFWDNDTWDLSVAALLIPDRAKSLVNFRCHTLPQAEERAKKRGYKGAMYPWESDPEKGTEVTAAVAAAFGEREIHVNSDVAIGQWEYYLTTGDINWLRERGYRVIREVADFWVSRSTYNAPQDRYEILHVTSPDEAYNDVANDAFTNASAQKALRIAAVASRTLGIAPDPRWNDVAQKMYIPFSQSEQRHLDFDETVPHDKHTWMGSSLSWLAFPPLDLQMSKEVTRNDYNFAIKSLRELTPDANDMVPVILSIEAAQLGEEADVYKWLSYSSKGFLKPPFNMRSETPRNNALYILCVNSGYLENFLYGFTGLRFRDEGLTPIYPPALPSTLKSVTLKGISLRSQRFDFIISRDSTGKVQLSKQPSAM